MMNEKEVRRKKPLSRLFPYAGRFKYLVYASIALSAISAALALFPFVYIWKILDEVLGVLPDYSKSNEIARNGCLAVLFAVVSISVYVAALMCSHIAAFRIARNIRVAAVRHVTTLPLGTLESMGSGKVRSVINESSAATETYLAHQTPDKAGAVMTPVCILAMLFVFDWRLGLASLVPVLLAFAVMSRMTGKRMAERMTQYKNALEDMNNEAVEYVRSIPVVKAFGQTVHSFSRFRESIERYNNWTVAYTLTLRNPMMWYLLGINGVFAFLTAATLLIVGEGYANPGFLADLLFYVIFTPIITVTLTKIMYSSENNMIVSDAMDRVDSILSIKSLSEGVGSAQPKDNAIDIDCVSFTYSGGDRPAIDGVSLRVPAGKTIALVGPSGGGKTTLAALVSRFWDVDSGSIRIGGVDVRDFSKERLMGEISCVFQNSRLLKMSILDNVRIGRTSASRDEVLDALHRAQCDDIIAKLPIGIDSMYGSKGTYLSGGECQRIAIARTILKDSPVVVFDEATAFADPENEVLVQKAFADLSIGRTVILIAHRLTTVMGADMICVLDSGKIVERGTHAELVDRGGTYARMWDEYQTAIDWKVGGKK